MVRIRLMVREGKMLRHLDRLQWQQLQKQKRVVQQMLSAACCVWSVGCCIPRKAYPMVQSLRCGRWTNSAGSIQSFRK